MDAVETGIGRFLQGMLPDTDDLPTFLAELACDAFVASPVVFEFLVPEFPVGFGPRVALGASVPETSVDEDGELLLWKSKVRPAS